MRLHRLQSLATQGVSLDTETFKFQQGLMVPIVVCGSVATLDMDLVAAAQASGQQPDPASLIAGDLLTPQQVIELFMQLADDPDRIIDGANLAFDLAVIARAAALIGIDVMPHIFRLLESDRVYDVLLSEALRAVAEGTLGYDPRTGGKLRDPVTGKQGRYSLSIVVDLVLGRHNAKLNDEWRLRYGELYGIPFDQWPRTAREYPVDDARNTHEVCLAQIGVLPKLSFKHTFGADRTCYSCGATSDSATCWVRQPHPNLHDLSNQVGAAFGLHMGAAWGFRIDQRALDTIEEYALRNQARSIIPFTEAGLVRPDGTENRSVLKKRIAVAYGAHAPCPDCNGTGKIVSPRAALVRCPQCRGVTRAEFTLPCDVCNDVGKIKNPKQLINCVGPDGAKTCDGTGLLIDGVPRSEKEGISYGRDTLHESGSEFLMAYGGHQEDKKDIEVYIPYFRQARMPVRGHDEGCPAREKVSDGCTCDGPYKDVPLILRPNPVLESGRVSYEEVIQQIKRKPGFRDSETGKWIPSLREVVVARPGYLFSSEDYESGELVTHGQSCIWITGDSQLARALVSGIKVHNQLAASMLGMPYDDFQKRQKERACADARQAAKPGNFGFPGLMGPPKMTMQQRRQGPDTPCPNGPAMVKLETGELVPGYKGLRFCILMDGAERCGEVMIKDWRGRQIPPLCRACVHCALRLRQAWMRQWPENAAYFDFVQDCMNNGMVVTPELLARWPHLAEVFRVGQRTRPAQIIQHVSGRLRGGLESPSACANGFFQGLLADAAKSALRRVTRECYDRTARVSKFAHENSLASAYGDGPSPLFGSRPIVFQHDEILLEHLEVTAHDAALRVAEIMVEELRYYCPDLAPACNVEPTLMRRWYKNAKPRWRDGGDKRKDANDRLIPWELPRGV